MLIFNVNVFTMNSNPIPNAWVEIIDGKISNVGNGIPPASDYIINGQGGCLFPGFIDAHTHLGIIGNGISFESDDCNEASDPFTPHLRALDAVNPLDFCFSEAYSRGITTVLTTPGSANAAGGEMIAVKTLGRRIDDMLIRKVGIKFALGENPKTVYNDKDQSPVTRMATAAIIREGLAKAQRYYQDILDFQDDPDENQKPDFDAKSEALIPLLKNDICAHFHCHRADDIFTAIRISKEFNIKPVLIHATEAYLVADILAAENVPMIIGPSICDRSKPELVNLNDKNASVLFQNNVKFAICTDHPVTPIQFLPASAAVSVKGGLPLDAALRSITCIPADILGISDRVGSISVGLDADLQLYPSPNPLNITSEPILVMINGEIVINRIQADAK